MCLAQGPQRSNAGEARTRGPSVLSQALYHWATALLYKAAMQKTIDKEKLTIKWAVDWCRWEGVGTCIRYLKEDKVIRQYIGRVKQKKQA